jgi:siroheme synthase (precorrin-2 oxidase/ferrochelatase)
VTASAVVAIRFFQDKFVNKIFDHKYETEDPQDIHNDIVFVFKAITQKRPSEEDDVLHVVEKENAYTVYLF